MPSLCRSFLPEGRNSAKATSCIIHLTSDSTIKMSELPNVQEMTTVQDPPAEILLSRLQELTTVQDNASIDTAESLEVNDSQTPLSAVMFTFQLVVCCVSLFGNLLLILVLGRLPNSKLRKTTKLLMRYVSVSHCLTSVLLVARLFNMPCWVPLLIGLNTTFSVLCGLAFLSYEVLIMATKPHSHQKFISMNICKVGIFISCLVMLCLDVAAYLTKKEPDHSSCYFSNGVFNPVFLCFVSVLGFVIMTVTSLSQFFTLRAMNKVFPNTGTLNINVIQVAPVNNTSTDPTTTSSNTFPLQKLTKMLTISLVCSIITWLPSTVCIFTFSIYEIHEVEVEMERDISIGSSSFVPFNGILHVIVYLTMSSQIKQAVRKCFSSWYANILLCLGLDVLPTNP